MASSNNSKVISNASPHTIKKFELVEKYIKSWAQKLLQNSSCYGLVFIDCMCNSGVYTTDNGKFVEGTPVRVAEALLDVARSYPEKQIQIYLNDNSQDKVNELKKHLPADEANFKIIVTARDCDELLAEIGPQLYNRPHLHYFLFYDPYEASINWPVLIPFLRNWGEVMINHMVSDTTRAITQVRQEAAKEKYENTYLAEFEELLPYGSDKRAYEERVERIIQRLKGQRTYFVGAFPFYNTRNSQLYSLIHCTSNIEGFKLYKQVAWKTFGGKSSTKDTHGSQLQLTLDFNNDGCCTQTTDESCFFVTDIAKYLQKHFAGKSYIPLDSLWKLLEKHPIFPSDGFRNEIKTELQSTYGVIFRKNINPITGEKQIFASFLKGNTVDE